MFGLGVIIGTIVGIGLMQFIKHYKIIERKGE